MGKTATVPAGGVRAGLLLYPAPTKEFTAWKEGT